MQRRGLSKPAVDYMALFSKYTQDYKIRFHGPQPDRFAFGKELFSEFRDRYQAYALSSGWSSGQQVAAMIRFLDGRPRAIFKEWINEGRLEAMDADVMWRLMKKRFCDPTEERQAARVELAQRIQAKGESLLAYEQVFSEMANRAGLSEEEMVERWVKNIDPEVANICRTHTAKEDLTFQEIARIARRADRQAPDTRPPQVAVKKAVHTVAAVSRETPEDTDDTSAGMSSATDVSVKSINAIKDALSRDLRREMATRQLEFDETIGSLKRKLDHMQVMGITPRTATQSVAAGPRDTRRRSAEELRQDRGEEQSSTWFTNRTAEQLTTHREQGREPVVPKDPREMGRGETTEEATQTVSGTQVAERAAVQVDPSTTIEQSRRLDTRAPMRYSRCVTDQVEEQDQLSGRMLATTRASESSTTEVQAMAAPTTRALEEL